MTNLNWSLYEQMYKEEFKTQMFRSVTDSILKFNEMVIWHDRSHFWYRYYLKVKST